MILLLMLFLHIVDDYYLQGILAKLKQKSWWNENAPQDLYKHDYIVGLVMHSFSWSFITMLPILCVKGYSTLFIIVLIANMLIHGIVDHLKCNMFKINLIQDQTIHILQIIFTFCLFFYLM